MTNEALVKKYAFYNFKTEKAFEGFLQTKYHKIWENNFVGFKKSLDCIAVKDILFTMDSYDEGQEIMWGNKEKGWQLVCRTANRYTKGYKDAEVELYPETSFRNDISYIQ